MSGSVSMPRYLSRFRCIAERCEDTCCTGLEIPVSAERYPLLRAALERGPDAAERVSRVMLDPAAAGSERHARIPLNAERRCPFLEEGLCHVQRQHGEEAMPDICVAFPRVLTRLGERLELAATLACPEAARLCLLAEDALALDAVPAEEVKRPGLARGPATPDEPSALHAGRIRAGAIALLERREYPLGSRLAFLGEFASALERPEQPLTEARLDEVLAAFENPALLDGLHARLSALELPAGPLAGVLASVLRTRWRAPHGPRFAALAGAVLASFGAAGEDADLGALGRAYVERRERLDAAAPERVEQYFRHAALNHWLRDPFTDSPDLLSYVFTLALRVALWRFALAGHPVVDALGPGEAERSPEARARLDAAAVETFQLIAKNVERHAEFLALARGLEGRGGAETAGKIVLLARFC